MLKPTVEAASVLLNTRDEEFDALAHDATQMLALPLTHYLGPILIEYTERYGYDHPAVTLGEVLAQALLECSEWSEMDTQERFTSFVLTGIFRDPKGE